MKKKILYLLLILYAISIQLSASAYQPKSTDYEIDSNTNTTNEKTTKINVINQTENIKTISKLGEYLKIEVNGKYGLIDKDGNTILAPVFQKISIIDFDGEKCFAAKADGKYRVYYNTGKLIPEEKLYSVVQNTSILEQEEITPQYTAIIERKEVVYTPIKIPFKSFITDNLKKSGFIYEIKEIPIIKVKNTGEQQSIEKLTNFDLNEALSNSKNIFTLDNKQFYILNENDKIGISTASKETIVPAKYDSFAVKTPHKLFKTPVFLMNDNGIKSIYDLKGNLLAEQVYNKINVYRNGNLYTFQVEEGKGILRENKNILGYMTKDGDEYKYTSEKFTLFKPHIINNLIITILEN
ncbi:WG repeat-containing protein [bacterium]|nr:WG repeat-containing protein [bacterium]